jgi:FkbM family methyltransferase
MTDNIKTALFSALSGTYRMLAGKGFGKMPGVRATYDRLFRLFWSGGKVLEVQGSRMYVDVNHEDPSMRKTFQAYALNRIHEPATTGLFTKVVKKNDVVLDLGANIGYFSLLAARLVGKDGRVYSFEPEPRNFGFLKKNIELNDYSQVTPNQKAVANEPGTVKLYICHYDTGHHTINQYGGIESYNLTKQEAPKDYVEVEKVALDDYLKDKVDHVDFIKMDVEGAEVLALRGMDKIIRGNKDIKMLVEFFPLLIKEMGDSPEELIKKLLDDYGFSMYVIEDDYSMSNQSSGAGYFKVKSVDEVMNLCKGRTDHINLFLKKGGGEDPLT